APSAPIRPVPGPRPAAGPQARALPRNAVGQGVAPLLTFPSDRPCRRPAERPGEDHAARRLEPSARPAVRPAARLVLRPAAVFDLSGAGQRPDRRAAAARLGAGLAPRLACRWS